jgi:predicted MFS family arabinose efflux permease
MPTTNATRRALLALALASFGIGTTEFVIMGLLPDVAHDLSVSIPQAGLLVGHALGVVFGAPILAIATTPRTPARAISGPAALRAAEIPERENNHEGRSCWRR